MSRWWLENSYTLRNVQVSRDICTVSAILDDDLIKQFVMVGDLRIPYTLGRRSISLCKPLKVGDIVDLQVNEYFDGDGDFFAIPSIINIHTR
ncbi:MAG: hypothetical protein FWE50_03820 [Alphaproteobacteria bacterium]|nr:hypothetical protein [Alphaproteobacteria bacterium]